MGLQEKRAIQEVANQLPQWTEKITAAAKGSPLAIEVNWDTLAVEGSAGNFDKWTKVFFEPLVVMMGNICQDDMGKTAFQAKYKKIIIQNTKDASSPESSISFNGDSIVLDHALANVDDVNDRAKIWAATVEKTL